MKRLSIAEATRKIVNKHPSILDCISQDVINFSALSRKIYKDVVELTGDKSTTLEAVKAALMRFSNKLKQKERFLENKVCKVLSQSTLELKNDVSVLTVKEQPLLERISEIIQLVGSRFFQLTQGTTTFSLVIDQRSLEVVCKLIGDNNIVMKITDQSAIILTSPEDIISVPGVIAYITSILARNNINITQIISCYTDTLFIVDRGNATYAYNVLEDVIFQLRGKSKNE